MSGKAVAALDAALHAVGIKPGGQARAEARDEAGTAPGAPTVASAHDGTMAALTWRGKKDVRVAQTDALLRVSATAICGSDLHLYLHSMPGLRAGDVLGHEFMGVVEEVGDGVKTVKRARARAAPTPSLRAWQVQEAMYGHASGGFYGYSHLTGGYAGGQADHVRVIMADANCLVLPEGLSDLDAVLLTDILPTAWHACEMGDVKKGDVVAIWGAGPVGLLTAHCAQHRGAGRVILIDSVPDRLAHAAAKLPGVETLDFGQRDTLAALKEMTAGEPGRGPDVCIEAAGFHYAKSLLHKLEMAVQLETDSADILNELITACRKGGTISIVGVYVGFVNHFNVGAFMEKQLTMCGGQTPVRRRAAEQGARGAAKGYQMFNDKTDGCIKVVLRPGAAEAVTRAPAPAPAH
ncbi:fdh [Scenedesmus sp. PABB004]|nr:fdh [Scenedesmus sp. PABB004]